MRKDRIRQLMDRQGLKVPALSEITGIPERTLWRLFQDGTGTTDDNVAAIAQALGCSSDYLLGLVDDPTPHFRIDNLSDRERQILAAIRRGDKLTAIHILSEPEKM